MPVIPFPEWRPDVSDYEGGSSQVITNVIPRGDGYGPFPDFSALSAALPGACRGYCFARNADGSILVVAGTATKLYKLNNTDLTWTDVSLGAGTYSALSAGFNWQFVQFNSLLFATQENAVLQVLNLTSPTAFANAAGSPPQASYIAIINRFLVLSGLLSSPYRVQWSGLDNVNASTSWDNVTLQSNFQDMADGGLVRGVVGGDMSGVVMQDSMIRSMVFNPGSPEIFDFIKISDQEGIFAPQSAVKAGGSIYFISTMGFRSIPPGGVPTPIGKEKFDRTFFADCDAGNLQFCIGAADPKSPRIFWAYKSVAGSASLFDRIIIYDWQLQRATLVNMQGEYLTTLATPGLTLESLDKLAPGIITVSGAVSGAGGAIKLTISGLTSGLTNLNNENSVELYGLVGTGGLTAAANGSWPFVINDSTHITLTGSTFTGAYSSGGAIGGALDGLTLSLDSFSTSPLAAISCTNSSHVVGFFAGANLEAVLETAEQELDANYRMRVQNVRPITDCPSAAVSITTRERLQDVDTTSAEATVDLLGNCSLNVSTRLARGKLRNPAGAVWTYAAGLRPKMAQEGQQ
jgi:hypothetical protein